MSGVRRRVVVHGGVQGVGFRDATARRARQRGVTGWVANRDDGAVEAAFEGDADDVESLVEFCRTGPSGAHVERVAASDEPPENLSGFEIR